MKRDSDDVSCWQGFHVHHAPDELREYRAFQHRMGHKRSLCPHKTASGRSQNANEQDDAARPHTLRQQKRQRCDGERCGYPGHPREGTGERKPSGNACTQAHWRSEKHTSELRSLMRISYALSRLKKKTYIITTIYTY